MAEKSWEIVGRMLSVSAPTVKNWAKLSVLVIDDMPAVTTMLRDGLTVLGQTVLTAHSGEEALVVFKTAKPQVVICDLGMDGMSGWDVGKAIKDFCRDSARPKPPFILMTGWSGQELESERIAESGVDEIAEKPLDIFALFRVVQDLAGKS